MSEPRGSLIYLMQYLEGHLSAAESNIVRRRLEQVDWQNAWQRLQLATVETTLPVTTWEEPAVSPEALAAFLEGTLSLDEAGRVERHCWESPELLRELVSTYRYLHVDQSDDAMLAEAPSASATERMTALLPGNPMAEQGDPSQAAAGRVPRQPAITADGSSPSAASHDEPGLPVVVSANQRSATSRIRRRRTPVWVAYAATIIIGLGLGLGAVVIISLSGEPGLESLEDIVTPSQGEQPVEPQENTLVNEPQSPPDESAVPPDALNVPQPVAPNRPFDVATDDTGTPSDSMPTPRPLRDRSPTASSNGPPRPYPSITVQWEKIDGLLAVRGNAAQPWRGARATVSDNRPATTFTTFPDSWASAKTNHGRLVLDADTQLQVNATQNSMHVNVERGRVAISEVPTNETVRLQVGPQSWIIKPTDEDTAIGCVVFARQTQLVVRRGRVSIGGTEIAAGRQIELKAGALDKPTSITGSTNWFVRSQSALKIPPATRDSLLASTNLRGDLARIWRTTDDPARFLAARWLLSIGTDQTLAMALNSRDDQMRMAALNWLLSCEPTDPRVMTALRSMAKQTDHPQMVRNVQKWLVAAKTNRRLTRQDADLMVAGLRSDHLGIRQISVFFLERAFGKRVAFDPKSGAAARQRAAREWSALLDRLDQVRLDRANRK